MRDGINFLDFKPQKKAVKIKTATIVAITYVLVTPKKFSPIKPNACIYILYSNKNRNSQVFLDPISIV